MRHSRTNRRTIAAAVFAAVACFHRSIGSPILFDPDPPAGGGGGGAPNGTVSGSTGTAAGAGEDDKKVLTITQADLNKRIAEGIAAATKAAEDKTKADRDAAEKARKDKEADDKRKADEAAGKHQELYNAEKTARENAERAANDARLESLKTRVEVQLRDHLADKHPDYLKSAPYIAPLLKIDLATKPEDIAKQITEAATKFVADNPRRPGAGSPPAAGQRGTLPAGTQVPNGQQQQPQISGPARRGF